MTTSSASSALVGLVAGIASALLLAGAHVSFYTALLMISAASLPVLIVGLGWSNLAAIVAVAAAGGLIAVLSGPMAALGAVLTSLAPAAWIAHLSSLARPAEEIGGPEGEVVWYPLSGILLQICLLVSGALVLVGAVAGYGPGFTDQLVDAVATAMRASDPELQLTPEALTEIAGVLLRLLPLVQGASLVLILFAMLYVAHFIVRVSGRSRRPKDDVPAALRMPRAGLAAIALGILLIFLPEPVSLVGWLLAGTFGAGFMLAGFALMHARTRGRPGRGLVLWLAYMSVFLFTLPALFFLALGLTATARGPATVPTNPKH